MPANGLPQAANGLLDNTHISQIKDIFPNIDRQGFDHVVMNPPYSPTCVDKTLQATWESFADSSPGSEADAHLAFTEMLWRLTSVSGGAAAVLPLSIGSNTSKAYVRLRTRLVTSAGTKEFLFFDREPQALFGEDIKTRNLILFRHIESGIQAVRTSRMLKWTAKQRPSIFTRLRLVDISPSQCVQFVPKLGSEAEAQIYSALALSSTRIAAARAAPQTCRTTLHSAEEADRSVRVRSILVSSTAYNFINCFFAEALPSSPPRPYSRSPLSSLTCPSEDDALAALAIASSRLAFWLWHVEGDGFHVTSDFLKRLPLWKVFHSQSARTALAEQGRSIWTSAKHTGVGSVNGGRQTYSFYCSFDHPSALQVEELLIREFRLGVNVQRTMDEFVRRTVSIDGKRRTRL